MNHRAGLLRHRITIKRQATTRGAYGSLPGTWGDTVATVWARIEPRRSREVQQDNQRQSERIVDVTIHWRSDVAANQRIYWTRSSVTRVFNIINARAMDEDRRTFLVLECRELDSDQL